MRQNECARFVEPYSCEIFELKIMITTDFLSSSDSYEENKTNEIKQRTRKIGIRWMCYRWDMPELYNYQEI